MAETILVHLSGVEGREAFCVYTTTAWVFRSFMDISLLKLFN